MFPQLSQLIYVGNDDSGVRDRAEGARALLGQGVNRVHSRLGARVGELSGRFMHLTDIGQLQCS